MRFPFVRRSTLDAYRRLNRESAKLVVATTAANDVLAQQLEAAQRERAELLEKLLRVGFGVNPYHELMQGQPMPQAEAPAAPAPVPDLPYGASPERVLEHFTREAIAMYGSTNMRAIKNYVERRQEEHYAGRLDPHAPTPEELAAAQQVARDLEAAIEEGQREGLKG